MLAERQRTPGPTPWLDPSIAEKIPDASPEAVEATKLLASYVWNRYGRFPATIDPFLMSVWYQAHHLDIDFYDRYYPREAVPEHIRRHIDNWHRDLETP